MLQQELKFALGLVSLEKELMLKTNSLASQGSSP